MIVPIPGGQKIVLSIHPLKDILPHEDTIPSLLSSILNDMKRSGSQRDPIVIDGKTKVALDGMHRRAALERLGTRFALCAEVNYESPKVILERWLRYFIAPERKFVVKLVSTLELGRASNHREAMRIIDRSGSGIALVSSKESYAKSATRSYEDLLNSYKKLSKFDNLARLSDVEVQFHPEDERVSLFTSKSVYVLYPPKLRKKVILDIALSGKVLPYKTTRHIIPARPMGLYFPLNELKNSDQDRCTSVLTKCIEESEIDLLQRLSWYEGRRYSEPLVVFRRKELKSK